MLDRAAFAWATRRAARPNRPLFPMVCERLTFTVGCRNLVDGINLRLAGRGTTIIMGYNGAGKSLLLRLMHGILEPTHGQISWGGSLVDAEIRKRQAMVFQKPVLLRRSVRDNIDFALRVRGIRDRQRRDHLLEDLGLRALAKSPARSLSGGEQQRLALARALAGDPDVLFLDEVTSGLDPASMRLIEEIVRRTAETGAKIISVSHDVGQARRLADDVVFIHGGRIAEHSPAERFFASPASECARAYLDGRIPSETGRNGCEERS
jgi:tungstate transport system ATP-binding protein